MSCPPGCLREKGHEGFHTTAPAIAEREDFALEPSLEKATPEAEANELEAIRLYLESCGLEEGEIVWEVLASQ